MTSSGDSIVDAANVGGAMASGAAIGALVGSVIPVIGTAFGAAIGTILGGATGLIASPAVGSLSRQENNALEQLKEAYLKDNTVL
jgi:predicted RecA/RadA family phage recombinase